MCKEVWILRRRWSASAVAAFCAIWAGTGPAIDAQQIIPLIQFTNIWRFEVSGADLGTAWREPAFDDSGWASGPGLLQSAESSTYPEPFGTTLPLAPGTMTCYFRTRFEWPEAGGTVKGQLLDVRNLVDDGCVIYLNGVEVGRIRVPLNQTYLTSAFSQPNEGQVEMLKVDGSMLRVGENVVAVEVHQAGATSADLVWGSQWTAELPTPLAIVRQPVGSTNLVGVATTLSVEVSGGPAFYQWSRDGLRLNGATNAALPLTGVATNSGEYLVAITNDLTSVTSSVARVVIAPNRRGPVPLRAVVSRTNWVDVVFNDNVLSSSVDVTNFSLTRLRNGASIPLERAFSSQQLLRIFLTQTTDWVYRDDYVITLSGVQDNQTNTMAPQTSVPVRWPMTNTVVGESQPWYYHSSALFDPGIYDQPWFQTNYVRTSKWGAGFGVFYWLPSPVDLCFGNRDTEIPIQPQPTLFRTTFVLPTNAGTVGTLSFRALYNDGVQFFLNGQKLFRYNIPDEPITAQTRALGSVGGSVCGNQSLVVSNLFPGTNWIAAAVVGHAGSDAEFCFGLNVDATYEVIPPLPQTPRPTLTLSPAGPGLLAAAWLGGGYALESSTNLASANAYPWGPWTEVPNMTNPYLFSPTNEPETYFRLRKK